MDSSRRVEELEHLRSYLHVLASAAIGPRLRKRVGASDVVQETLIEAYEGLDRRRGETEAEKRAWLRRILANNIANAVRDHGRKKRDVALEQSIHADLSRSSAGLERTLVATGATASEAAVREEHLLLLSRALATLPEDELTVVVLYHVHGRPLDEIASELGVTRYAVTRSLRTATRHLRVELENAGLDGRSF